jgi:hypothetical protein
MQSLPESPREWYQEQYVAFGDEYLEGIEYPACAWAIQLCMEHDELRQPLHGLSFAQQIAFLNLARTGLKSINMPLAWGAFNNKGSAWALSCLTRPELMEKLLEEIKPTTDPVAKPLPLLPNVGDIEVVELLSGFDLHLEGAAMKHCVGGYTQNVAQGLSRIFSLRQGPLAMQNATVEWGFKEDKSAPAYAKDRARNKYPLMATLNQIRSQFNQDPAGDLKEAEKVVRKAFNEWARENPQATWDLIAPKKPKYTNLF